MPITPRQRYQQRLGTLRDARAPFDLSYREIGNYVLPWRTRFEEEDRLKRLQLNSEMLDPTAMLALRTCGAGMATGFCSATRVWFRFGLPAALIARDRGLAQKPAVKRYLANCEEVVRDVLLRSNFYGVTTGYAFRDLPAFGVFAMFVEEHWRTVMTCNPMPIGQYWLGADAQGEVDTCHRRFTMTVSQMVQRFGLERCSARVRDQYRRGQFDVGHVVRHVVEPNRRDEETGFEGQRAGYLDWRGMDFRSVWFEESCSADAGEDFLSVSGYRENPVIAPRWSRVSPEDVYGSGAGHEVLPDVKQLQTMVRRKLQLVEKSSTPPLKGSAEVGAQVSQLPGAFTRVPPGGGAGDELKPIFLPAPAAIQEVRLDADELRWRIREGLFADLFRLLTDDERKQRGTAEEIRGKKEERLGLLGPVSTNVEGEYLRRSLDRAFALADRAGLIEDPPEELAGQELKVDFISVFGEAQRAQEIPAVERVANFVNSLAAIDPEVLDTLDADKFADKYAEIAMLPPDLMRSPEAREAIRQARAQRDQAAAAGAAMQQGASTAKDLAGAGLESDNALNRIVGTLGPVVAQQALAGQAAPATGMGAT